MMTREDAAEIVERVEALYAGSGPPPRTVHEIRARDGLLLFRLGGLFIECVSCGMRQPQSRTRQSPEARGAWVEMHLACRR